MLKKILLIIGCCACCALSIPLTGCMDNPSNSGTPSVDGMIRIYVDEETGVNYIRYSNGAAGAGGITPRYNADGSLYVEEQNNEID